MKVSLSWAVKGSYRKEHVMAFLRKWLHPWDELRAHRRDWRILLLDVAKSHVGTDIVELAHSRGTSCCTTMVAQRLWPK